jgi:hypothetical protein
LTTAQEPVQKSEDEASKTPTVHPAAKEFDSEMIAKIADAVARRLELDQLAQKRRATWKRTRHGEDEEVIETDEDRRCQLVSIKYAFVNSVTYVLNQEGSPTSLQRSIQIKQDEDFVTLPSARSQCVEHFTNSSGSGPDSSALRFDMHGSASNAWNQAVFDMLVKEFKEKRRSITANLWLPKRPDNYIKKLFIGRFKRCSIIGKLPC